MRVRSAEYRLAVLPSIGRPCPTRAWYGLPVGLSHGVNPCYFPSTCVVNDDRRGPWNVSAWRVLAAWFCQSVNRLNRFAWFHSLIGMAFPARVVAELRTAVIKLCCSGMYWGTTRTPASAVKSGWSTCRSAKCKLLLIPGGAFLTFVHIAASEVLVSASSHMYMRAAYRTSYLDHFVLRRAQ